MAGSASSSELPGFWVRSRVPTHFAVAAVVGGVAAVVSGGDGGGAVVPL